MSEPLENRPGIHCHHEEPDSACALCIYRDMEKTYMVYMNTYLEEQTDETVPQAGETG